MYESYFHFLTVNMKLMNYNNLILNKVSRLKLKKNVCIYFFFFIKQKILYNLHICCAISTIDKRTLVNK